MNRLLSVLAFLVVFAAPAGAQQQIASVGERQQIASASPQAPRVTTEELLMTSVMPVEKEPAIVRATQNLRAGAVLHSTDLLVESGDETALDLFVGMELKRAVYQGKILSPNFVGPPTIVERNAIVQLEFARGPLTITTEGRALDAGAMGESVRIMNLNSKIILSAVITGPNKAVTR